MDETSNGVEIIDLPIEAVVYREDLYPRSATLHEKVQEYAENLEVMPPIEVNQHNILIDGWHRWMAHKKQEKPCIQARVTLTASEMDLYDLAMERNNKHGAQISREDKRKFATKRYTMTPVRDRPKMKEYLLQKLSISESTLYNWIRRVDEDTSKTQRARCYDLWLACHTLEDIAEQIGVNPQTVANWVQKFSNFLNGEKNRKSDAEHATDFIIPQKNVWTEHDKTPHLDFPGSTEPRWVDNLLYFYTQPFDIVIDPFAGSGSTIEVCKKRLRRYWVSDRKPIPERAHEIRLWDMTEGLPPLHNWRDAKLVYLDPPYWKQAEGDYSQAPSDLANMTLEDFTTTLARVISDFGKKLQTGAHIALIIQPTHWYATKHTYIDHAMDMMKAIKLPLARRIACPCDTPRYTEYLKWCLEHREMLSLNREIIVWRVP
jgi:transposase-like protein